MSNKSARRIALALVSLAMGALCSGCWVHHLEKNAPGHIDVHEKPEDLEVGWREAPEDPGEEVLSLLTGPYFMVGVADGEDLFQLGFEATLNYHRREKSHHGPLSLLANPDGFVYGANLGWTFYDWGDAQRDVDFGAVYLEGQLRHEAGPVAALGYSVEPATGRNGPQVTLSAFGMNWARFNYNWDGTYSILYGVTLKIGQFWVWTQ